MRTAKPSNIRDDVLGALDDIVGAHAAVGASGMSQGHQQLLAEYAFLGTSILIEGYISDLLVAYINKAPSVFANHVVGGMSIEAEIEPSKSARKFATIDITSHLTMPKIREILDQRGFNISYVDAADLKGKAGQWLEANYAQYFTGMTATQMQVLNTTRAIRNFLAHRSSAAKDAMQASLKETNLPTSLRRGNQNVNSVGYYLERQAPGTTTTRLAVYLAEIRALCQSFCP